MPLAAVRSTLRMRRRAIPGASVASDQRCRSPAAACRLQPVDLSVDPKRKNAAPRAAHLALRLEAAEGIRTLDLLHGNKRGFGQPFAPKWPICRAFLFGPKRRRGENVQRCAPICGHSGTSGQKCQVRGGEFESLKGSPAEPAEAPDRVQLIREWRLPPNGRQRSDDDALDVAR